MVNPRNNDIELLITFLIKLVIKIKRSSILNPQIRPKAPPISDTKAPNLYVASSRMTPFCSASFSETDIKPKNHYLTKYKAKQPISSGFEPTLVFIITFRKYLI